MKNLTLKQLRYFEALARHRHFRRASEASSISQPALSMQIKELEAALGSALFERNARNIRLTEFGEDFAKRVREILRLVEDLDDLVRSNRERPLSNLRLGVIPTIAPYMLPGIISRLGEEYPGMDVQIRESQTQKLTEELADNQLDMAMVALPITDSNFVEWPLFEEEFLLVRNRVDGDLPVPNAAALAKMKLLLLEEGHCFRDQALSFCKIKPSAPRDNLEGSSLSTLVQMVGAGIGVTLIPEMAARIEARSADVSLSRFDSPKPHRKIGLIWRQTSPLIELFEEISRTIGRASTTN